MTDPTTDPTPDPTPGPDQAADRPSGGGRGRIRDALLRPSRGQLVVSVLLAVLGFGFVTQVTSFGVGDTYSGYRQQALIDVLDGLAGTTQRTEAEIARLEQTQEELRDDSSAERAAVEEARRERAAMQILAGVVPVTGPGIRVTITEESGQVDIDSMLDTVQEMRTAFAEAMQFNGEVRVVARTSFEDAPGGMYVDGTLLEPPYVIDVIGDPHTLHGGLTFPQGPIEQLQQDGATVQVEELDSLDIESTVEPERLEFAVPDGS